MINGNVTFSGFLLALNELGKERNEMRFKLTTGSIITKYIARIVSYSYNVYEYKIFRIDDLLKDEYEVYSGTTGFIHNFGEYETIRDLTIVLLCTHRTSHFIYKH